MCVLQWKHKFMNDFRLSLSLFSNNEYIDDNIDNVEYEHKDYEYIDNDIEYEHIDNNIDILFNIN